MITEWRFKKLDQYPDRIICDDGSIYNRHGKILKLKPSKKGGYLRVRRYNSRKEFYTWVHRMVCYAFVGDCSGKDVHHKDRNRQNNHWWNFEIKTEEEHYAEHKKYFYFSQENKEMEQENEME